MATDDVIIKVSKYIGAGNEDLEGSKEKKVDFDILERTGVSIAFSERKSAYGKTKIQTFTLEGKEHSEKIVDLLNNPILYAHISKVFDYICKIGQASGDDSDEKRYFAARSVSILSDYFPFADLEGGILSKWAKRVSSRSNQSAALALVQIIKNGQHQKDVINLINYWSRQPHIGLVNTVLLTYSEIADIYPTDAFDVMKNILLNEKTTIQSFREVSSLSDDGEPGIKLSRRTIELRISRLIKALYLGHPLNVIETLHKWFQDRTNFSLTIFAALTFLSIINVRDIAKDDAKRAKTIAYVYDLWEGKNVPEYQQLQQLTTKSVYSWAKTVLEIEATDPDQILCQQFFHELYQKCASTKQNRLEFHLRRWHNQFQQSGKVSASSTQPLNFLSLIPDSKQA